MKKKLASILLCLCMVLTLLPTAALADAPASTDGVTYKNGETTLSGDSFNTTPDADGKITLPGKDSVTKTGYTFVGWSDGAKGYLPGASYTVPAGGKTLTALWTDANTSIASSVAIAGKSITSGQYYHNGASGAQGTVNSNAANANAMLVNGVLVLSNLNVNTSNKGIKWTLHDLVIYLLPGSTNNVTNTNDTAINGEGGGTYNDYTPDLSIRGSGTLNVTGYTYGIWAWKDITIESGVTLVAEGGLTNTSTATNTQYSGIAQNASGGMIDVKGGANVVVKGKDYGVLADNGFGQGSLNVARTATFTASGGKAALKDLSSYTISPTPLYVGNNQNGTGADEWNNTTPLTSYKYISTIAPGSGSGGSSSSSSGSGSGGGGSSGSGSDGGSTSHTHNWTYDSAIGSTTITATCDVEDCIYTGANAVTITLTAPTDLTYNGSAKEATVTCNVSAGVLTPPTPRYQTWNEGTYGSFTSTAPTDAGKYKASIELGKINHEVTVEVTYEIVVPYGISLKKQGTDTILTGTTFTFDDATVGYTTQPSLSVTVKNTGTQETGNLIVTITGDNAAAFSHDLAGGGLGSLRPSSSSAIPLTVKPVLGLTAGTYTATVSVGNDNVPAQTFTVSFTVTAGSSTPSTPDPVTVTIVNSNGTAVTAPKVGDTLRANVTGAYGTPTYQWFYYDPVSPSAIDDATDVTYTLKAADVGKKVGVKVTGADTEPITVWLDIAVAANSSTPGGGSSTPGGSGTPSGGSSTPSGGSGTSGGGSSSGGSSSGSSSGSSYHVTLPTTGNGNVTSDRPTARKGDTVTITLTPDAGYRVDGVVVKDQNGKQLTVKRNADGTYSFTMPAGKVTVEPVFVWQNPFVDVSESNYYASAVEWALKNGVTGGTDATHFSPDAACTRGQLVTFLYRWAVANGVDVSVGENTNILSFNDAFSIPEYAVAAFQWAVGAGIVQGNGGNLMPNQTCTRAQAVAFLFRFAASQGMDAETLQKLVSGFGDAAQVPGYALSAFDWALANSIVQGDHGNLMPNNDCTRAHIVTFLYRFLGE